MSAVGLVEITFRLGIYSFIITEFGLFVPNLRSNATSTVLPTPAVAGKFLVTEISAKGNVVDVEVVLVVDIDVDVVVLVVDVVVVDVEVDVEVVVTPTCPPARII